MGLENGKMFGRACRCFSRGYVHIGGHFQATRTYVTSLVAFTGQTGKEGNPGLNRIFGSQQPKTACFLGGEESEGE